MAASSTEEVFSFSFIARWSKYVVEIFLPREARPQLGTKSQKEVRAVDENFRQSGSPTFSQFCHTVVEIFLGAVGSLESRVWDRDPKESSRSRY